MYRMTSGSASKLLDVVFHRVLPEPVLEWVLHLDGSTFREKIKKWFAQSAEMDFYGYSENEQTLFFNSIYENNSAYDFANDYTPPWQLLVKYGDEVLLYENGEPKCRFDKVPDWRETFLQLGQDIIITAWLSYRQYTNKLRIAKYSWLPIIQSDYRELELLLAGGIAENHYHLNGSSDLFAIAWSCIMTYPKAVKSKDWINTYLQPILSRGESSNVWKAEKRLLYAAFIRYLLFLRLRDPEIDVINELRCFDRAYGFDKLYTVDKQLAFWRNYVGMKFSQPGNEKATCLDYTFTSALSGEKDEPYRIMSGERKFMADCFEHCYSGEFDERTQAVFYAYLLIKSQFRTELVQANRQVGFTNFSKYENRKKEMWGKYKAYCNEAYRTSLIGPNKLSSVRSIEARVCPDDRKRDDIQSVHKVDRAVLHANNDLNSPWRISRAMDNRAKDLPYFFVFHFPKNADAMLTKDRSNTHCRHEQLRQAYKKQAIEFVKALHEYPYFRERVRGIDACNHEIPCRPEVFGNIFRYIRDYTPLHRSWIDPTVLPRISFTYHVGEDFLDIVDGLRAMDEAMLFLDMRRGDRLGHALALGVDPQLHYNIKSSLLILPKQDCLDNFVWICNRAAVLGVSLSDKLRQELETKAHDLFYDIYRDAIEEEKWCYSVSMDDYFSSWFLRGDSPKYYRTGKFNKNILCDSYDLYGLNPASQINNIDYYRRNPVISGLYYYYHYSSSVKRKGQETVDFKVTEEYLLLMGKLQNAMKKRIDDAGIFVECNPSSNVLIGTFQSYDEHPIFRFNSHGLTDVSENVELNVSINTDDRGIFDTSLPFEYVLIAATLAQERDEHGQSVYSKRIIEDYIRNLIAMSKQQIFPA